MPLSAPQSGPLSAPQSGPWLDISRPVHAGMPVWPGDPATTIERAQDQARGDACTVTGLCLCAHAGTHVDAPLHYLPGTADMDAWPLEAGIGPARVVAVCDPRTVTVGELLPLDVRPGERLLFKTANSARPMSRAFTPDYVSLNLEAARFLAARRVRLVGVDGPSVGPFDEPEGCVHRALLEAGIWILENLDLCAVPAGPAELVCLPLRLAGAEAAPARAALRPLCPGRS